MCSINGFFNVDNAEKKVVETLKLFKNRGRDACGITNYDKILIANAPDEIKVKDSKNAMGHTLHSIVSYVPQPIKGKRGILISNCEIYNWLELAKKEKIEARNDSELLLKLLEKNDAVKNPFKVLDKLDGVFAFAYWQGDKLLLAKDLIGIKPLWYSHDKGFCFASEKKALKMQGNNLINELNPRTVLIYDIKNDKTQFLRRDFFKNKPENKEPYHIIKKNVRKLFLNAVAKRIPKQKIGLFFSGGVDSTLIALTLKKLGVDFICYTSAMVGKGLKEPEDLTFSRKIAKEYSLKLKEVSINIKNVEKKVRKTIRLIEDTNVVKVGVGITFLSVAKEAEKDGIKVIFSGLGSEEIFAGYKRHRDSNNVNDECISGLLKMYERDLYRDDVISMNHNIELRLPFLDKKLVDYSLKIPDRFKLNDVQDKLIIRDVAEEIGLKGIFAQRKKRAAQYGSRFDAGIAKLAKKNGFKRKSEYLSQFSDEKNLNLAVLYSGGKDSNYALYLMQRQNYKISCLVTLKSKNLYSYMFHTPAIDMTKVQSKSLGIPLIEQKTSGKKEEELKDLKKALIKAKKKYNIEGVITGAIFSNYQRQRIENVCDNLSLKIFNPLWHTNQKILMEQLIAEGFEMILTSVSAYGLDKTWLGRKLNYLDVDKLSNIDKKIGINIAFEGGEAESLVLDMPLFNKKIKIRKSEKIIENENTGRLNISDYELVNK